MIIIVHTTPSKHLSEIRCNTRRACFQCSASLHITVGKVYWKVKPGRSGFTQNFDSGSGSWSGRKLQNPAGVDSFVPLDRWPPLPPNMHCNYTLYSEQKNLLTITYSSLYTISSFALGGVNSLDDPWSFAASTPSCIL